MRMHADKNISLDKKVSFFSCWAVFAIFYPFPKLRDGKSMQEIWERVMGKKDKRSISIRGFASIWF